MINLRCREAGTPCGREPRPTDPSMTRAGVEDFVANLDNLGRDFLGRYVVFTTSGSTGVPALLCKIAAPWP